MTAEIERRTSELEVVCFERRLELVNRGGEKTVTIGGVWNTDHSESAHAAKIPIAVATRAITVPTGGAATVELTPPIGGVRCEAPWCWTMSHYEWLDRSGTTISATKPCSPGHP